MTRIGKNSQKYSKVKHPLDSINMRHSDREVAKDYMEGAELFADLVCRAESGLRSIVAEFGQGCRTLAHRTRAAFGKPAHH